MATGARRVRRGWAAVALFAALASIGAGAPQQRANSQRLSPEAATARRLEAIRTQPPLLYAFLRAMPKGGDLHSHLSGAIYAESYLRWAAEDKLCVALGTMAIVTCESQAEQRPASEVIENAALYNRAIDAMSMRNWDPMANGRDHFFASFAKFGPASTKTGEMLAEATSRAASENVSYLELMLTPDGGAARRIGRTVEWVDDFEQLRERVLAAGLRETVISEVRRRLDAAEARQREVLHCASPPRDPGCDVTVRYIAQVARAGPRQEVFAELVAWFELVAAEPRVVSFNLVQPEDDPRAIGDFPLHMRMIDVLHRRYPNVPITLHAGEITAGLVPTEVLRSHIRQSVTFGHARRLGHGVDIFHEDNPFALLRELATKRILVEVALSSNDLILGIKGDRHPLRMYLQAGVPVALATDDLGVARSSHTQEWLRAVTEHGIDYRTLKQFARNSLEFAFMDATTKQRLQANLERAFIEFERSPQE
jgi:adenosine deaminase